MLKRGHGEGASLWHADSQSDTGECFFLFFFVCSGGSFNPCSFWKGFPDSSHRFCEGAFGDNAYTRHTGRKKPFVNTYIRPDILLLVKSILKNMSLCLHAD